MVKGVQVPKDTERCLQGFVSLPGHPLLTYSISMHCSDTMGSSCITQHLLKSGLLNEILQKLPSPAFAFHKKKKKIGIPFLVEAVKDKMLLKACLLTP